jgi:hypothetical protein
VSKICAVNARRNLKHGGTQERQKKARIKMTIEEAIELLGYGTAYEIQGAYSGKIYHRSYVNTSKNLDKYFNREASDSPFYVTMAIKGNVTNKWCMPVIGIWMRDYDLAKEREK